MRDASIARNYASALVELARRANDLPGWGTLIDDFVQAMQRDERLRNFLESPRVSAEQKNEIVAKALQDRMPRLLVRFLHAVITHRRQMLIPDIALAYHTLVDELENRLHAQVTVSRQPDPQAAQSIARELSRAMGKTVIPHFAVRPEILGGVIVRVGDTVMDGSVRRRLESLRTQLA